MSKIQKYKELKASLLEHKRFGVKPEQSLIEEFKQLSKETLKERSEKKKLKEENSWDMTEADMKKNFDAFAKDLTILSKKHGIIVELYEKNIFQVHPKDIKSLKYDSNFSAGKIVGDYDLKDGE